jgi:hypothetical protein
MFLYHLFMPNNALYEEITACMAEKWTGRANRMKRVVATAAEFDNILSKSVFQQYQT